MRFTLHHLTRYTYSQPVFLEPHTIRLTPRRDVCQDVLDHSLSVHPAPAGRWEGIDAEGNPFVQVWFDGLASEMVVEARTTAVARRENPFGFLLPDAACRIPPELAPGEAAALAACLRRGADAPGGAAARLAESLRARAQGGCLDFLLRLNGWIFENVAKVVRREPGILAPEDVCSGREGACRDAAVLFMACCRRVGIPARFVSGYQAGDAAAEAADDGRDLHAWAEAYLPGAGWLGLDPTHGLVVGDHHLALAASHDPARVAPVRGSLRGTGARSALRHELTLSVE